MIRADDPDEASPGAGLCRVRVSVGAVEIPARVSVGIGDDFPVRS